MTSKLTKKERVQALYDLKIGQVLSLDDIENVKMLARMALAAMDSEPVAWEVKGILCHTLDEANKYVGTPEPLYRHAQQPVVMDDTKLRELFDSWFASDCSFDLSPEASEADNIAWRESYWYVWQRCRAAMLQAQSDDDGEPTDDERIMAIEGIIPPISSGNSPVIPGAEQRIIDAVDLLKQAAPAMLADNGGPDGPLAGRMKSQVVPGCWCRTCRPVVWNDMRFVVCPDCGNKRCPRANDHRNACSGSNKPGQEGSAYPAAPQSPGSDSATVPTKWIPVSERMPEKNQSVLISVNFDSSLVEPLICSARYTGSTFRRGDATVKPGSGIEQATHWMPLPAAPQELKP